jgi:hypothetical protein
MSARKTTPRRFTAAERATLDPLIVRAAVAAVRQAEAEAAYDRHVPKGGAAYERSVATEMKLELAADDAQRETCTAGKALARALKKLRGGK